MNSQPSNESRTKPSVRKLNRLMSNMFWWLVVVLFAIALLYGYEYLTRPPILDSGYPTLVVVEPYLSEENVAYITETLRVEGYLINPLPRGSGLDLWVDIDGIHGRLVNLHENEFSLDLPFPQLGEHTVEIYLTYQSDWRTWESSKKTFQVLSQKETPTNPVITGIEANYVQDQYFIMGYSDPNVLIRVEGAKHPSETNTFPTDLLGQFRFWLSPEDPDQEIKIIAENSVGGTSFTSLPKEFTNPKFIFTPSSHITTTLTLKIAPNNYSTDFFVELPVEHPALDALLSGNAKAGNFIESTVGNDVRLNGSSILYGYQTISPEIHIDVLTATVKMTNLSFRSNIFPLIGPTNISFKFPDGFPKAGNDGKFRMEIKDYQVSSVFPKPDKINDSIYEWDSIPSNGEVKVVLTWEGQNSAFLNTVRKASIFDLTGTHYSLNTFLSFLLFVIRSLPLFWILIVFIKFTNTSIGQEIPAKQHIRIVTKSIILFLATSIWSVIDNIVSEIYSYADRFVFSWLYSHDLPSLAGLYHSEELSNLGFYPADYYAIIFLILVSLFFGGLAIIAKFRGNRNLYYIFQIVSKILFLLLILQIAGLLLVALLNIVFGLEANYVIVTWIVAFVIFIDLLTEIFSLGWSIYKRALYQQSSTNLGRKSWIALLLFVVALLITYNTASSVLSLSEIRFYTDYSVSIRYFFGTIGDWIYLYGFMALLLFMLEYVIKFAPFSKKMQSSAMEKVLTLDSSSAWTENEKTFMLLGKIVFVGFIIGMDDRWLSVIPMSFLIALWLYKFTFNSPAVISGLKFWEKSIRSRRSEFLSQLANDLALKNLIKKRSDLIVNLARGKINPSEYDKSLTVIDKEEQEIKNDIVLPTGASAKEFALALGFSDQSSINAWYGIQAAFVIQIPLLILYASVYYANKLYFDRPYVALNYLTQIVAFSAGWLIIGFFFGLFYEYIRGSDGIRKALYFSAIMALSLLPYRLIKLESVTNLPSVVFELGQMAIFTIVLGGAFDWKVLRDNGYSFLYMRVVVSDVPSIASLTSIFLTTAGIVITSYLTGQLSELLTSVLPTIVPNLTNLSQLVP